MIAAERYMALLRQAREHLLAHACDCGNVTCADNDIRELADEISAEIRLYDNDPPGSSTIIIEKAPDRWMYVVTPGPLTAGGPNYRTQEAAQEAAERAIEVSDWPKKVKRKVP